MSEARIIPFERFDLRFEPRSWAFADANRAAIDARFAARQRVNPALWNGRVLLAHEYAVSNGVCRGALLETDFASLDSWREWGRPAAGVLNCFAAAILRGSDGGILLGVMGPHTANAGQMYFPCGTPEPADVVEGRVDMEGSARHELKDETGLSFEDLRPRPGWISVELGGCALAAKVLDAAEPAEVLRQQILRYLGGERQPELSDIRVVRGPQDLNPAMPPFVSATLHHIWR